jgi:hypothetical protein
VGGSGKHVSHGICVKTRDLHNTIFSSSAFLSWQEDSTLGTCVFINHEVKSVLGPQPGIHKGGCYWLLFLYLGRIGAGRVMGGWNPRLYSQLGMAGRSREGLRAARLPGGSGLCRWSLQDTSISFYFLLSHCKMLHS